MSCVDGKYLDTATNTCKTCNVNCKTCKEDGPSKCATCKTDNFLDSEVCYANCPLST